MKRKHLIEFIMFFSYLLFAMSWVGATAFMKEIMQLTGMHTLTEASFLSTALTFAKIIGTAIAAWTITRFGIRNAFSLAAFLMCFSIVTPYATNFPLLLLARFLMGLGGALVIVYFNPIVYQLFLPEERAVVNGLNAIAFNVGTTLMMFGVPTMLGWLGNWQHVLTAISLASLGVLVLWLAVGKVETAKPANARSSSETYRLIDGLKDKFNWIYAFTYSGLLSFYIVLFTFYPKAGIVQSKQVILFGIVGAVAGIVYAKRTTKRVPILRFSGALQLVAAWGLSFAGDHQQLAFWCAALLGFFMFLPMPALVTLAQERKNTSAQKISVTFSLFWSLSYLLATIVPTVFAKIVDSHQGDYQAAFVFICVVEASFFLGSLCLRDNQ